MLIFRWLIKDRNPEYSMVAGIIGAVILFIVGAILYLLYLMPIELLLVFGAFFMLFAVVYFLGRFIRVKIIKDFEER